MAFFVAAQPPVAATSEHRSQSGLLCSTSGTVLQDRDELRQHYSSDLHRYNLKRKVAGLPPVTQEWFEARKAQLSSSQAASAQQAIPQGSVRTWFDPLTRKVFRNEQTYLNHVKSKKYQDLVAKSGEEAPPPVISIKKVSEASPVPETAPSNKAAPTAAQQQQGAVGFKIMHPSASLSVQKEEKQRKKETTAQVPGTGADTKMGDEDDAASSEGGWETASDDDDDVDEAGVEVEMGTERDDRKERAGAGSSGAGMEGVKEEGDEVMEGSEEQEWKEWEEGRSLFDNHVSKSFEANLEYMWHKFGFYLPDAQYLKDPEGLVKYLGAKLQYGLVPLYTRGDDATAKSFRSLHAVQRHMVDSGRCKMVYEDNEDEYADFYDYEEEEGQEEAEQGAGKELVLSGGSKAPLQAAVVSGFELHIPGTGQGGSGGKVLGSREFARYYKQRYKPGDERKIVVVNALLSKYRALGVSLHDNAVSLEAKKLKTKSAMDYKWAGKRNNGLFMRENINRNLPKNCTF